MIIADIMTKDVHWVEPGATFADAAKLIRDHDYGALPIGRDNKLIGVITDRDIVVRCCAEERDPKATPVQEMMSEGVYYCFAERDVAEAAKSMAELGVRRLPVVDPNKRLVGIVSLADIARNSAAEAAAALHTEQAAA